MEHEIIIKVESEKEWKAICALSSILEKSISTMAKEDLMAMTKNTANRINEDKFIYAHIKSQNEDQLKMLMAIL